MAVVFDASVLIDLFDSRLKGDRRAKLELLIETLQQQRTKILVPTLALTELMIKAGKARDAYYQELSSSRVFRIEPFDARAAMECAMLLAEALSHPEQRAVTRVKFKFDWQIVAIAASRNARVIYSDDGDLARYGRRVGVSVIKTAELPLPESKRQQDLDFGSE